MNREYAGGCLCGAIRFTASAITDAGYCHCATCRRHSGAPVSAYATVPGDRFEITRGEPALYPSSERGRRAFCAACGSVLWFADDRELSINLGALDDPAAVEPRVHIYIESQLPWLEHGDLLPAYEGGDPPPPGERPMLRGPADPRVKSGDPLSFRPVGAANLGEVLFLGVTGPQQRFVASNAFSLAEGLIEDGAWIRAIYAGEVAVGFVMAAVFTGDEFGMHTRGDANLWRFMIDRRYQGLGFGGRALDQIIDELGSWPGARAIWLGATRGSGAPYAFYIRRGFVDTGAVDRDEAILRLDL